MRIHADKIVAVIEHEPLLIKGTLVGAEHGVPYLAGCDHIGHCAIGALLAAAGITDDQLNGIADHPNDWLFGEPAHDLLYRVYGLRRRHISEILIANDATAGYSVHDVPERRRAVIDTVLELASRQAAAPEFDLDACDRWDVTVLDGWAKLPTEADAQDEPDDQDEPEDGLELVYAGEPDAAF